MSEETLSLEPLVLERKIADEDVREAIRLKCANCYGALSMCNALGGGRSTAWDLCHKYPLKDILAEAARRGIDLAGVTAAVDGTPVTESLYYKRAAGVMTEQEFRKAFSEWQNSGRT